MWVLILYVTKPPLSLLKEYKKLTNEQLTKLKRTNVCHNMYVVSNDLFAVKNVINKYMILLIWIKWKPNNN